MTKKTVLRFGFVGAVLIVTGLAWTGRVGRETARSPERPTAAGPSSPGMSLSKPTLSEPSLDQNGRSSVPSTQSGAEATFSNQAAAAGPKILLTPEAQALLQGSLDSRAEFEQIAQLADLPDERAPGDREFLATMERTQIEDELELSELGQALHQADQTASMLGKLKNHGSSSD